MNIAFSKRNLSYVILCLALSVLIILIPWDFLNPRGFFIDRENYLFSYEYRRFRLVNFSADYFYDYVTNEWLWRYFNVYARNVLNLSPHIFFGIITFYAFFTYSLFILSKTKKVYALLYLFNPIFISFIYSQLRLALAMAVFITAIYLYRSKFYILAIPLFICCFLIHTSMLLFMLILIMATVIARFKFNKIFKLIFIVLLGFLLNLLIGPLRYTILSSIGDRRAEYSDISSPAIFFIIYAIYFLVVVFTIFKFKFKFLNNYAYNYAFIIFSFIIFSMFLGGYTSRFVAATQCFIIASLFLLKGVPNLLFHLGYIFYLLFLWYGFFV